MLAKSAHILLFFLAALALLSCKKDPIDIGPADPPPVYAGIHDTTFQYFEYTRGLSILWDAQKLYGVCMDSLDIDKDGTFDFFMTLHILNPDSLHLLPGLPEPFPYCKLHTINGFEMASYEENYYIGLGQTRSITFIDRLDFNERVDVLSDWLTSGNMWAENPGGFVTPPYGDWHDASSENYIALNKEGQKYGWVKL